MYFYLTFQIKKLSKEIELQKCIIKNLEDDHSKAIYQVLHKNKTKVEQLEKEKESLNEEIKSLSDVFRVIKPF